MRYITITKQEFKNHLREIRFVDKKVKSFSPTYDGFWLREHPEGYEFFERERGQAFNHKILRTEDEVLDVFVGILGWCCKQCHIIAKIFYGY